MSLATIWGSVLSVSLIAGALPVLGQEATAAPAVAVADASSTTTAPAAACDASAIPVVPGGGAADAAAPTCEAKPVAGGKGKKEKKKKKEKPPPLTPLSIVNGTLTVDGYTGKATLNYDIPDLHYLYLWAPGLGLTMVSNKPFTGATEQKDAFTEQMLDVMVDGHKLEVYSDTPFFDKKKDKSIMKELGAKKSLSAWVRVDPDFELATAYPAMGYGNITAAPYAWPGSKMAPKRTRGVVTPPPMPSDLRPVMLGTKPSPAKAGIQTVQTGTGQTPPPTKQQADETGPAKSSQPAQGAGQP